MKIPTSVAELWNWFLPFDYIIQEKCKLQDDNTDFPKLATSPQYFTSWLGIFAGFLVSSACSQAVGAGNNDDQESDGTVVSLSELKSSESLADNSECDAERCIAPQQERQAWEHLPPLQFNQGALQLELLLFCGSLPPPIFCVPSLVFFSFAMQARRPSC